jgi:3-isopropylmalate/(R)-2-methylmalate dehydratase small subunit
MDSKRIKIQGRAILVRGNDIDTDRIIPARFLKTVTFDGLGDHAFEDDRKGLKEQGQTHPFDDAKYAGANVLFVNKNFGCGSSREHAPQAIMRWGKGIEAIVGESFAEIFYGNCQSLGIPCLVVDQPTIEKLMNAIEQDPKASVEVNIESRTVSVAGVSYPVTLADGPRKAFLDGSWDSTYELIMGRDAIAETAARLPYIRGYEA